MTTIINPYLAFKNEARQAIEFYQGVFGGQLSINTFKDFNASQDPSEDNKIMHAMLTTNSGMVLMAADVPNSLEFRPGNNISISLSGENEEEMRDYWNKLSDGAVIREQLAKAPWGDIFGMLTDKFGIEWLVNIAAPKD